jgi:hypothetical protein
LSSRIAKNVHCFFAHGSWCHGLVSRQTHINSKMRIPIPYLPPLPWHSFLLDLHILFLARHRN